MAYRYPTVKPNLVPPAGTEHLSHADQRTLQALFPGHPGAPGRIYGALDGEEKLRAEGLKSLLGGVEDGNPQVGRVDKDYGMNRDTPVNLKPPTYADVPTNRPGDPASAWVPNPMSPGVGSTNPKDKPSAPDGYGETPTNTLLNPTPASSEGRDPFVSSQRMAAGQEYENLVPGMSSANVDTSS